MGNLVPIVSVVCVFGAPVAIVWIVTHYRAQRYKATNFSVDEQAAIETLTRVAERLEERMETIEKILDIEQPRWRQANKDTGR